MKEWIQQTLANNIITRKKGWKRHFHYRVLRVHSASVNSSLFCRSNSFVEEIHYEGKREYTTILLFHLLWPYQSPANTVLRPISSSTSNIKGNLFLGLLRLNGNFQFENNSGFPGLLSSHFKLKEQSTNTFVTDITFQFMWSGESLSAVNKA